MEHKKYNLSVELEATNAKETQKDIQQVAETVRKTGDEAQKAGRVVSNSLGSAVRDTGDKAKTASRVVSSSLGSAFRAAGSAVKEFASASVASLKKVGSAAMSLGRGIKTGLLLPIKAVSKGFGLLKGVAIGAAAGVISAWLQVKGVLAALGPASDMQQYQIQMEVLLKDADKASRRLSELKKYAKETNYSPQQVIQAANLMQSFGIYTFKRLQILGDVANAFGRDISEIVTSVNYLASGRSGEALESLSRFGVTRQKLTEAGMQFAKNGSLITEPKKAIDILFNYMEKQFGGMTARQAKTWKGALQQLGGQVWDSMANGFKGALKPMTAFVTERLIPAIEALGKRLETIDWEKALSGPLKLIGGATELFNLVTDPKTMKQGMAHLKALGEEIKAVFTGVVTDIGGLFSHFAKNGGFEAIGGLIFNSIAAGAKFFVALMRTAWDGMANRMKAALAEVIPGMKQAEQDRKDRALARAYQAYDPAGYSRLLMQAREKTATYTTTGAVPRKQYNGARAFGWLTEAIRERQGKMNAVQRHRFNKEYNVQLGYDTKEEPNAASYFNGVLAPVQASWNRLGRSFSGYRFNATGSALLNLGDHIDELNRMGDRRAVDNTYLRNEAENAKFGQAYEQERAAASSRGKIARLLGLRRDAMKYASRGWTGYGRRRREINSAREGYGADARDRYSSTVGDFNFIYKSLTDDEKKQYAAALRAPVRRPNSAIVPPRIASPAAPSASSLIPDIRKTRGASFSAPVAAVMEEEEKKRKRRTSRNNGLGSGQAITGGRTDGVLRRHRRKTRGDVLEETAPQGGKARGSSGKSVESAIEKGFQKGFEKLEAKIGKRIFVVV